MTSYARRNLFSGILEFKEDYLYADTDSIKCLNIDKHSQYIRKYNQWITRQIDAVLNAYNISAELSRPKNIKGESKQIGVWDWETKGEPYTAFKSLGAKRYMYEQGGDIHITIAGVSKKLGRDYIRTQKDPFEFFDDGMTIPPEYSGKLTHTYLDEVQTGTLTDYKGASMEYEELSSVHLEPASYNLTVLQDYKDYIRGVKRKWKNL